MNSIQKFEMMLSHMDNQLEEANKAGIPLMVEEKKNSNGYIPKIGYWKGKLMNAETPMKQVEALNKIRYFQKQHYKVYGEWVDLLRVQELG
jgi:hypothetical protein